MDLALREEPLDAPGARPLLECFAEEIASLYPGWTPSSGPRADPEDFAPPGGVFLVAYAAERAVGCGGLKRLDANHVEIKRLYVAPEARGAGVARRILAALEQTAAARGYGTVRLDTGAHQPAALALFESVG